METAKSLDWVVEPLPGHNDQEVIDLLKGFGVEASALTPGRVNCHESRESFEDLSDEQFVELAARLEAIAQVLSLPKREGGLRRNGLGAPNKDTVMAKLLGSNISGQALVEYALMMAFVAMACVTIIPGIAGRIISMLKLDVGDGPVRIIGAVICVIIIGVIILQRKRNPGDYLDD
ncbi:MAG: hypothetical protein WC794_04780 [Candidatus Doudnabacteria bacterium]|jgi:Flp pilus assembly pilin Flp